MINASFSTDPKWNQPKHPPPTEWINEQKNVIYTVGTKANKRQLQATAWRTVTIY